MATLSQFRGLVPALYLPASLKAAMNNCTRISKTGNTTVMGLISEKSRRGSGFGKKLPVQPVWDAAVLLRRSEDMYEQLLKMHFEDGNVREYVVCIRKHVVSQSTALDDWLPVAELALVSDKDALQAIPEALHLLCREVAECASKGAVSLRSIPRSHLEYAYEPAEDFYSFVLASSLSGEQPTGECPFAVLGLPKCATASEVRLSYRMLAAKYHPDKFIGGDASQAVLEYKRVVKAYEEIKGNQRQYSYASIGGQKRQGLSEPVTIRMHALKNSGISFQAAVRQLDPDIISLFLARSRALS